MSDNMQPIDETLDDEPLDAVDAEATEACEVEEFDPFEGMSDEELDALCDEDDSLAGFGDVEPGFRSGFVALVGRPNAGKSTLLNQLTGAGIPANNRLFDTLDTTSRQLTVSDNLDVILSDTVGFIAKLPHHLVDAFRATLEELEYADVLLHVIDAADPNREEHIAVVEKLIRQLSKEGTPVINAYNKADLVEPTDIPIGEDVVAISARTGDNMSGLLKAIEKALDKGLHHVLVCLPYSMGGMVDTLHNNAQVKSVDYTADGIEIETVVDEILYGRLREYIIEEL